MLSVYSIYHLDYISNPKEMFSNIFGLTAEVCISFQMENRFRMSYLLDMWKVVGSPNACLISVQKCLSHLIVPSQVPAQIPRSYSMTKIPWARVPGSHDQGRVRLTERLLEFQCERFKIQLIEIKLLPINFAATLYFDF